LAAPHRAQQPQNFLLFHHQFQYHALMHPPRKNSLARKHLPPEHHPLAYFITFHTYGTWLHGDEKGSVDPQHRFYGQDFVEPDSRRHNFETHRMKSEPVKFQNSAREIVERTIAEVCSHRGWILKEQNVRTNHVHAVIAARDHRPERVADDLKAWCTRRLREAGVVMPEQQPWSRGRSNPYLWRPEDVEAAIEYVRNWQGTDLHDKP
jgi:REP element-mobilizing transposase RayT